MEWYCQRKTDLHGGKPDPVPLRPPQISHGLTWNQNVDPRNERPATNGLINCTVNYRLRLNWSRFNSSGAVNHFGYKNQSVQLCREIIAVGYYIRTKHINALCGESVGFFSIKPGGTCSNHWASKYQRLCLKYKNFRVKWGGKIIVVAEWIRTWNDVVLTY